MKEASQIQPPKLNDMINRNWYKALLGEATLLKTLMGGSAVWMLVLMGNWAYQMLFSPPPKKADGTTLCRFLGDENAPDFTLCIKNDIFYLFAQKEQFKPAEISSRGTPALHIAQQDWSALEALAKTLSHPITATGYWYNEESNSLHLYNIPLLLPFLLLVFMAIWRIHWIQENNLRVNRLMHEAREQERLHLARELHDGPLQELQRLALVLSEKEIAQSQEWIQPISHNLRAICANLRPPALAHLGLDAALESFAQHIEQQHLVEIHTQLAQENLRLSEYLRLVLFRVAQEAVQNAIKHAAPHHLWIRFRLEAGQAVLEVQNDGRGFSIPKNFVQLAELGHYGLLGMQERLATVNGNLYINSDMEAGTTLTAVCPIQQTLIKQ